MFEVISFLKKEFNAECPREQNIKCFLWCMRYRQNNSNNCACALSALSIPMVLSSGTFTLQMHRSVFVRLNTSTSKSSK